MHTGYRHRSHRRRVSCLQYLHPSLRMSANPAPQVCVRQLDQSACQGRQVPTTARAIARTTPASAMPFAQRALSCTICSIKSGGGVNNWYCSGDTGSGSMSHHPGSGMSSSLLSSPCVGACFLLSGACPRARRLRAGLGAMDFPLEPNEVAGGKWPRLNQGKNCGGK